MRFFKQLKLTQKVLLTAAVSMFFTLSSPAMATEVAVDSLLNSMINSAIEATKSQLTDAIETTLENTQLFDDADTTSEKLAVLKAKPSLSVDTTAAE